jgi:hypothetical protein
MNALKTIGREALGLFIADARFTVALICWMAMVAAIPAVLPHASVASALLLFAGFAAILIENLLHIASNGSR